MNRHERPPPSALLGDLVDLGQRQRKDPLAADWFRRCDELRRVPPDMVNVHPTGTAS
jgi:hypothetical protein